VAALAWASSAAFGQSFEAAISGGVSHLQGNVIGSQPTLTIPGTPVNVSGNNISLNDGFRLTFRMSVNPFSHLGFEGGYAYNRSQLHFDGPPVSETGFGIHQGFIDALMHFAKEGARLRPFVAGGLQFSNFVPPGASAQYGQGENKFGINYGAGVKVRVKENWQVRFDVRQYETGKPFSLPGASGRLLQDEISVGIGYVL
jgi:opacity protein-like surface antigen